MKLAILVLSLASTAAFAPRVPIAPAPNPASLVVHQRNGLVPLATLQALPAQRSLARTSMPVGVITDARSWKRVASAANLQFGPIDFKRQMVVYAVLGAQTNSLGFRSWTVNKGVGTLTFRWSGIEPFYIGRTPAVFAVVGRTGVHRVEFVEVGQRNHHRHRGAVAAR